MTFLKEFTLKAYREMLRMLKREGYAFLSYEEADQKKELNSPFVLLRHDLDFDIEIAEAFAKIENEEGVNSTFFVLLSTQHYNFFSNGSREALRKLIRLGHRVGLHFDATAYSVTESAAIKDWVNREAQMLQTVIEIPITVVSFHRPLKQYLRSSRDLTSPLIHTYEEKFFSKITYLSDSKGTWSKGHPLESEAFLKKAPIQILTHPIWWHDVALTPAESLELFRRKAIQRLEASMASNCKVLFKNFF